MKLTKDRIEWQKGYWQAAPLADKNMAAEMVEICDLALQALAAQSPQVAASELPELEPVSFPGDEGYFVDSNDGTYMTSAQAAEIIRLVKVGQEAERKRSKP